MLPLSIASLAAESIQRLVDTSKSDGMVYNGSCVTHQARKNNITIPDAAAGVGG